MDIQEIIKVIPQLFLLFIPGYISIMICKDLRQYHKIDDKDMIIKSIIYSFIIDKILVLIFIIIKYLYQVIKLNFHIKMAFRYTNFNIDRNNILFIILLLLGAIVFGYILAILPECTVFKTINTKLFKSPVEPYSSVWNFVMKSPNGAWAIVYLDDINIAYIGVLEKFTSDPNLEKEVYLIKYKSFNISTKEEIVDYTNDSNNGVWINSKDIKRIEIFKESK